MFASRLVLKPAVGQVGDLRQALGSVTEHRQSTGATTTLTERIWSESGPRFAVTTLFETLALAGEAREEGPDSETVKLIAAATKHIAGMGDSSLWEIKLGSGPVGSNRPNYVLRANLNPSSGKGVQLREALVDYCKTRIEAGIRLGLVEQVWGSGGIRFVVRLPYASIAEAEAARNEAMSSPDYQKFVSNITPLLGQPTGWELEQVIVPMNRA